jgi:hypothetical protein
MNSCLKVCFHYISSTSHPPSFRRTALRTPKALMTSSSDLSSVRPLFMRRIRGAVCQPVLVRRPRALTSPPHNALAYAAGSPSLPPHHRALCRPHPSPLPHACPDCTYSPRLHHTVPAFSIRPPSISSAYSNWRSLAYRLGEHALTEIPLARIPRRCQLHHTPASLHTPARRRDFVVECALNCEPNAHAHIGAVPNSPRMSLLLSH